MDVNKLINIYLINDAKNTADNEHIVFKLQDGLFSHGTFVDETHTFWQKNKDIALYFITLDEEIAYTTSIMYLNGVFKYYNFTTILNPLEFNECFMLDLCAKIKFFSRLKLEVYKCNIKSFSIIFKACMTREQILPYVLIFLTISKIYEHQQSKYMPKHIAKLRKKITEKAINELESY